jgi:1-acyl-sn-glycerol-3-phosphate acyltransferase
MWIHQYHQRPLWIALLQSLVRWVCRIVMTLFYRIRVHGLSNYPDSGGVLICCNHQSFLDPVVMGVSCPRPINYLARKTLFRFTPMKVFLELNDAIAIDRDSVGIAGIKASLKRLKRGETVLMFPEGTRCRDGQMQSFKPGFDVLARRSKSVLLPVALDGCFQAYPRNAKLPRLGRIQVVIGQPIPFEEYQHLSPDDTKRLMESKVAECFAVAARKLDSDPLIRSS